MPALQMFITICRCFCNFLLEASGNMSFYHVSRECDALQNGIAKVTSLSLVQIVPKCGRSTSNLPLTHERSLTNRVRVEPPLSRPVLSYIGAPRGNRKLILSHLISSLLRDLEISNLKIMLQTTQTFLSDTAYAWNSASSSGVIR
jgi:hypothetical protein